MRLVLKVREKPLATSRESFYDTFLTKELGNVFPPPLTLKIEPVVDWPETWLSENRLLAVFSPELFQWWNEEHPSSISEKTPPFWREIGFSSSIDALLKPETDASGHQRLSHTKISRIEGMQHWKASSAELKETEHFQNDRFPDYDTDLNLTLNLTGRSFEHLVEMIKAHTPNEHSHLWLCVGFVSSKFEIPKPRKMDNGRAPPDAFTRDLKADRIFFELGLSHGSGYIPDHIESVVRWMTIEGVENAPSA